VIGEGVPLGVVASIAPSPHMQFGTRCEPVAAEIGVEIGVGDRGKERGSRS